MNTKLKFLVLVFLLSAGGLSAQNIQVLVNGAAFNGFAYNQSTKKVTFSMSLIEGSNSLTIKGTNAAGEAQDSRTILYKKESIVYPPKVTFINSASSATETTFIRIPSTRWSRELSDYLALRPPQPALN